MGDYVLKMCEFIPLYFRMLHPCQNPSGRAVRHRPNCPSLNILQAVTPDETAREKKEAGALSKSSNQH